MIEDRLLHAWALESAEKDSSGQLLTVLEDEKIHSMTLGTITSSVRLKSFKDILVFVTITHHLTDS